MSNDTVNTRYCARCKQHLPATEEYFHKSVLRTRAHKYCKSCAKQYNAEYRKTHPTQKRVRNDEFILYWGIISRRTTSSNVAAKRRAFGRYEGLAGIGIVYPKDLYLLMDAQQWQCMYCKDKISFDTAEIDHVYPIVKGGDHYLYNVVWACTTCNGQKHDSTLRRFCKKYGHDFEAIAQQIADIYHQLHDILFPEFDQK